MLIDPSPMKTNVVRTIKIDEFRAIKFYDELYMVDFNDTVIRTTVTNNPQVVIEWISEIERIHSHRRKKLIVGLVYQPKPVAVLQLCVDDRCLIYQLNRTSKISETLFLFITSPLCVFVGPGIVSCLEKFQEGFGIDLNNLDQDWLHVDDIDKVEFGILAKKFSGRDDLMNAGLQQFAEVFLNIEMGTPGEWTTMIYWDYKRLTESQVGNACIEAFISFQLGKVLKADCFKDR